MYGSMSTTESYITTDRECTRCNYNLRGLPSNGKCPECGLTVVRYTSRTTGTMSDEAPSNFVRQLQAGFVLAFIGAVGSILSPSSIVMVISTSLWIGGIYLTTMRRPGRGTIIPDRVLDNDRFRLILRSMNATWLVYAMLLMAFHAVSSAPNPSGLLTVPIIILLILTGAIAWAAFIPTSIYFAELSYWASHDNFAQRLRGTAWAMAVFGTLAVLLSAISMINIAVSPAASFLLIFVMIILVIAFVTFFITVLQLASVMSWVVKHQRMAEGSSQRVRERIERDIARPGTIATGLHCEYCDYDLDGLPLGGVCPECGESFADQTSTVMVLDPAKMYKDRDESEIEVSEGDQRKGIYFNSEMDAFGKPKASGQTFDGFEQAIPDEGDIPLSDGPSKTDDEPGPIGFEPS